MSLDGYIADKSGKVDWLKGEQEHSDDMQSYTTFIKDVDTIIMGWNTYHQVASELSPDQWYYCDLQSYVCTHRVMDNTKDIVFTQEDPVHLLTELKKQDGKNIWICGGAQLIAQLVKANVIDRYHISIIPTLLGDGIALFKEGFTSLELSLLHSESYNGIVDVVYERRYKQE